MTFKIIVRGHPSPTVAAEYMCPEHGRFELDVERTDAGDAPDFVQCVYEAGETGEMQCGHQASWCISSPLCRVRKFEAVKGKWAKPERPTYTDTRNLGEGQALYDWKEDRAKVWEEKRKQDVMKFAKEH